MTRLDTLRDRLAASMDGDKPKPGFTERAMALRYEIALLESAAALEPGAAATSRVTDSMDPASLSSGQD